MDNGVKKIFVVDDDEMLSMALEDYLERKTDYEVHLFNTGEECLRHIDEQPDIIILDYNLNSVVKEAANGLIILEAIKRLNGSIKVVMLSTQDAKWLVLQTTRLGAEDYVIKDEKAFEKIVSICSTSLSV
jgi:DNA-binding NarL/FixJ family response regulator